MKVLVTGATSGLGRNAVEYLRNKGISVRATGRNEAMGKLLSKMGAEFIPADLTELVSSQAKVMLAGIDTLWHCSSFTSPWGTQQAFDLANVRATRRLGEWSVAWGVRNFVHISSPSLYFDYHHHRDIQEDFRPHRFANEFARSKAASEEVINLLAQANPHTRFTILRPQSLFGPHDKVFIPRLAQMMQHYGSVLLPRGGSALVDMTYYENAVHAMWLASQSACDHLPSARAWNISNGEPRTLRSIVQKLIDELGIETFRGCDNTTMWYNGPYVVEEYIQGNTKSYIPNPSYYDAANVSRFERLTITMISDGTISLQLYENRELDEVDLGESSIATIQADPSNEYNQQMCEKRPKKFSYCFIFNYDKRKTDGTADENWNKAIANKAFRQCFSKGLELSKFFSRYNPINPLKCENDFFTMSGLCYTTDGTDYTSLVAKELGLDGEKYDGKTMKRLRANNGDITDLKKQAMDELSAIGVTFPVHCSYYILAGSTTALDSATVLKQCFTDSFGDDFIVLDIETFVSSTMKEVVAPKLQSFVHMGWGADFGDPINFLTQIIVHDDNAYYSCNMTNIEGIAENGAADYQKDLVAAYEQFTDLVNEGRVIVNDTDARYAAFAKAEAYFLEENLIFPTVYDVTWCLTHANEYSKINAMYGPCNYKAVNWETSEEAYTTEQYEEFAAAFDAATQA